LNISNTIGMDWFIH